MKFALIWRSHLRVSGATSSLLTFNTTHKRPSDGKNSTRGHGAFVTAVVCINTCYIVYIGWFLRSRGMPAEVEKHDTVDH